MDIEALARDTEGFSGADLQALVYNAHLEVVHDAISAGVEDSKGKGKGKAVDNDSLRKPAEEKPIEYVRLGGPKDRKTLSRAEETALQRRVSSLRVCLIAFADLLPPEAEANHVRLSV